MRRHARSDNRPIVRKLCERVEEEPNVAAEIGSRVFPFRSPPASMPSVGARRSTRVFVTKAATAKPHGEEARVLRSAKRLAASGKRSDGDHPDWQRVFEGGGDGSADLRWREEGEKNVSGLGVGWHQPALQDRYHNGTEGPPEPVRREETADCLKAKRFRNIYSRKRRRLRLHDSVTSSFLNDRRYGIRYARKRRRKKPEVGLILESLVQEIPREDGPELKEDGDSTRRTKTRDSELEIAQSTRNFAEKVGISEGDLCTGWGGPVVLVVLIDSSCRGSSNRFLHILISMLSSMRRASMRLWDFAAVLFSDLLAAVFSLHGIHFLWIRRSSIDALSRNAISGCGLCKIYGANQFVPLLSLDFSTFPLYFKSLHMAMVLGSQYLPGVLIQDLIGLHADASVGIRSEESDSHVPEDAGFSGSEVASSVYPAVKRNRSPSIAEATEPLERKTVTVDGFGLWKHLRKKRSLRHHNAHNPSSGDSHATSWSASSWSLRKEHVRVKPLDACLDLLSIREDGNVSSPFISHRKHRKSSRKIPVEGMKDLKSALAEVKQKIDSVRCNANILVTDSYRCWREYGAEVMLEFSGSNEWCIAVKAQGMVRFLHKPQDMRPCVVNRFTRAYMWAGEDGWKLEFCNKWDWHVFKELLIECRVRNTQDTHNVPVKIIPIPGVREVSGYDEIVAPSFVRPDMYIQMTNDEVGRVLASEIVNYDVDSGDEEFLINLNSSSFDAENNDSKHISEDNFEKIVFALEKDAYNCPGDISNKERALDLCQDLGTRDMVATIFDYWLKKRNKRCEALVKVFQGPSLRRRHLIQKSFLRKKRSLPRQRSHVGRGKPSFFLQAGAKQQAAIRRAQEAQNAANKAMGPAIHLRSRAQKFMAHAELATYKSVMALRIAEAKWVSKSSDLSSSEAELVSESSDLSSTILD